MDKKIYKNTRYQNIYKHIKNGNYLVMMSKPVKTSISRVDGKKIFSIDEAIKIRDNVTIRQQKAIETLHKEDFDTLWDKYIDNCKYIKKQAYNTLNRKLKNYNRYLKDKINKPLAKTNKEFWAKYIDDLDCTDKQKNEILKTLKVFFNWCTDNEYLINNPTSRIEKYKMQKNEMKFWIPEEIKKFFDYINNELTTDNLVLKKIRIHD